MFWKSTLQTLFTPTSQRSARHPVDSLPSDTAHQFGAIVVCIPKVSAILSVSNACMRPCSVRRGENIESKANMVIIASPDGMLQIQLLFSLQAPEMKALPRLSPYPSTVRPSICLECTSTTNQAILPDFSTMTLYRNYPRGLYRRLGSVRIGRIPL